MFTSQRLQKALSIELVAEEDASGNRLAIYIGGNLLDKDYCTGKNIRHQLIDYFDRVFVQPIKPLSNNERTVALKDLSSAIDAYREKNNGVIIKQNFDLFKPQLEKYKSLYGEADAAHLYNQVIAEFLSLIFESENINGFERWLRLTILDLLVDLKEASILKLNRTGTALSIQQHGNSNNIFKLISSGSNKRLEEFCARLANDFFDNANPKQLVNFFNNKPVADKFVLKNRKPTQFVYILKELQKKEYVLQFQTEKIPWKQLDRNFLTDVGRGISARETEKPRKLSQEAKRALALLKS